mgnify:CR=1 FL=1
MLNEVLFLNSAHQKVAQTILDRIMPEYKRKYIISLSGEVETGKAEIAYVLGRMLKAENIKVKILYLDSYYKVPPAERTAWRKENGIESIGPDEYDWDKVNENIDAFLKDKKATLPMVDLFTGQMDQLTTDFKEIDVLIVAGLYSMKVEKADLKVFIENTYKDTMSVQKLSGKEELDEYRMQVLAQEHKVVQSLKKLANFYVDFDTNIEAMRLV